LGVLQLRSSGRESTSWPVLSLAAEGAGAPIDANGNLTQKVEGVDTWIYEWTADNQLKRALRNSVEQARFTYDAMGRRVERIVGGTTTTWAYDDDDILRQSSGASTIKYIHGPGVDEPMAYDDGVSLSSFHADALDSIAKTTNSVGAVTVVRQYDPWGAGQTGGASPGYAFTGRDHEPAIGLLHYRARYYDPRVATFLSEDPMGPVQSSNLYAYVDGNPVTYADPYGLYKRAPGVPPVNPYMEGFLLCLDRCTGKEQTVTATTNGTHRDPGHAGGTSVDIRPTGTPSKDLFCCAARCGAEYALDERTFKTKFGTGPHYHIQLVPPTNPKRDALPPECKPFTGDC